MGRGFAAAVFGVEPVDDVGGREVGGDDEVGVVVAECFDEGGGVELFEGLGHGFFPGLVGGVVDHAEEGGGAVDEVEIELGVNGAEDGVGVFEDVPVFDVALTVGEGGVELELFEECVGGADVAGAGGGGEEEDSARCGGEQRARGSGFGVRGPCGHEGS